MTKKDAQTYIDPEDEATLEMLLTSRHWEVGEILMCKYTIAEVDWYVSIPDLRDMNLYTVNKLTMRQRLINRIRRLCRL